MSGEAGFTIEGSTWRLFIGAGVSISYATLEGGPSVGDLHAGDERALRKRYEPAANDVGPLLASVADDGVPLTALAGAAHKLTIEGPSADKRAAAGAERYRLELGASRPLADSERALIQRGVEQLLWPPLPPVRKVHHLSCATFCPIGAKLFTGHARFVAHCLLVETEQGLVLVDTGLGIDALTRAPMHTSPAFLRTVRPVLDVQHSAARQIERLGHKLDDVKHIVLTHLDIDHAGGLPDFPGATVHVVADEHKAALAPASALDRQRYRQSQWAHDVKWQLHETKGERWYGFPCVRDLPGLPPEILLVPLAGHTRGHAGVAVDVGGRWILHCGDAYFHKDEVDPERPRAPLLLVAFEKLMAVDEKLRRQNQARLRDLVRGVGGDGVTLFCAHDPDDLVRMREG